DSDFDVRNAFSAAITYDVPAPKNNVVLRYLFGGWSTQNQIQARSATPVDVLDAAFPALSAQNAVTVRPDRVSGESLYLYGAQYPGGKALNPAAFTNPPLTPVDCIPGVDTPCNPTRQGNLARNAVRAFGLAQWDFAVHRDFSFREAMKLQFRAEMFNIL